MSGTTSCEIAGPLSLPLLILPFSQVMLHTKTVLSKQAKRLAKKADEHEQLIMKVGTTSSAGRPSRAVRTGPERRYGQDQRDRYYHQQTGVLPAGWQAWGWWNSGLLASQAHRPRDHIPG